MFETRIDRMVFRVLKMITRAIINGSTIAIIHDNELSFDVPLTEDEYWRICVALTHRGFCASYDIDEETTKMILVHLK
jgi:hypothetical protein